MLIVHILTKMARFVLTCIFPQETFLYFCTFPIIKVVLNDDTSNYLTYFVVISFLLFSKVHLSSLSRRNRMNFEFFLCSLECICIVLKILPRMCEVEGNNNLLSSKML